MTTRALRAVGQALTDNGITVKQAVGQAVTKAAESGLIHNAGSSARAVWKPS